MSMPHINFNSLTEYDLLARAAAKRGCSVAWIARAGATCLAAAILGEPAPEIPETLSPAALGAKVRAERAGRKLEQEALKEARAAWKAAANQMADDLAFRLKNKMLTYSEMVAEEAAWYEANPRP